MKNEDQKMIFPKMLAILGMIGAIGKDQKNTMQNYTFRGIDQFMNELHPALVKHGVFVIPKSINYHHELKDVVRSNGKSGIDKHVHLLMEYTFMAEDGSFVTIGPMPAEGLDSGDKATTKALSAAFKYALMQIFSIPTEDIVEQDKHNPEIGKEQTKHDLEAINSAFDLAGTASPEMSDLTPPAASSRYEAHKKGLPIDNRIGHYKVKFGKHANMELCQRPLADWKNYCAWLTKDAKEKTGGKMSDQVKELCQKVAEYEKETHSSEIEPLPF